ncbi:putative Box C/D snoRNP rRNA 2'-O-methylation factor [Balamuthia mandrillaris]
MEERNQPEEVVPEQTLLQEMDKEAVAEEETSEQNTSREEEENENENENEEEENKRTSLQLKPKPLRGNGRRTKISRGGAVKYKGYCENCFCLETARWRKGRRGETFCDKCGWAEREHKYVLMGNMRKQGMTSIILDMLHNSAITFVLPALMEDGETQRTGSGATISSSSSSSSSVKESMGVEQKEKRNEGEKEEEKNDRADELRPLRKKRKEDDASGEADKEEEDVKYKVKVAAQEHSSLAVSTPTTSSQ